MEVPLGCSDWEQLSKGLGSGLEGERVEVLELRRRSKKSVGRVSRRGVDYSSGLGEEEIFREPVHARRGRR